MNVWRFDPDDLLDKLNAGSIAKNANMEKVSEVSLDEQWAVDRILLSGIDNIHYIACTVGESKISSVDMLSLRFPRGEKN